MKTELSSLKGKAFIAIILIGLKAIKYMMNIVGSNPTSTPINRAYNHALTPEYFRRYSKESSIVKEIGQHTKLMLCLTLTTSTFSILKRIYGCPNLVTGNRNIEPHSLNQTYTYKVEIPQREAKAVGFFSLDDRMRLCFMVA